MFLQCLAEGRTRLFLSESSTPKRKQPCEQCTKPCFRAAPTNSHPSWAPQRNLLTLTAGKPKVLNFLPSLMLFEVPEREEQGKINQEMLIILLFSQGCSFIPCLIFLHSIQHLCKGFKHSPTSQSSLTATFSTPHIYPAHCRARLLKHSEKLPVQSTLTSSSHPHPALSVALAEPSGSSVLGTELKVTSPSLNSSRRL